MRKKLILVIFVLIMNICVLTFLVYAVPNKQYTANEVNFKVLVNGNEQDFNLPIVTIEDRTYLPARELCDAIGYAIDWHDEVEIVSMYNKNNTILNDDVNNSREGYLKNGRKYVFYGTDQDGYTLNEYIEKLNLKFVGTYNIIMKSDTIEKLAEDFQQIFDWDNEIYKDILLVISYDSETNSLIFRNISSKPHAGGISILVINCADGTLSRYSNGLR